MWARIHPLYTIDGFAATMLAIGRITGLVGLVMYALNLIFSTRLRFLEYLFGGLNRVYIAHHLLGGLALIFLSLHPFFLALRYVHLSLKQAALVLLPNGLLPLDALFNAQHVYHGVVLEQWAIFFGIIAFWGMVGLLLVTFFVKLPYRIWLFTHKFLGPAFFIAGLHVLFISSDTSINAPMKYYILAITALGIAAFIYKTILGNIFIRRHKYLVSNVQTFEGDVVQVSLEPTDLARPMAYKPGQFVYIKFTSDAGGGVKSEWHPFSISSHAKSDQLQLTVKGLGDYTKTLHQLKTGTIAEVEGAYGRFSYKNFKNQNQVWIAGGIGITPFLSMALSLSPDDDYHIDLYYSVKTRSELIDFQKLANASFIRHGKFGVYAFIGDEENGYLGIDFIKQHSGDLAGKDFFICGPPPMMQSLRGQLKAEGVPGARIHSEEFAMS